MHVSQNRTADLRGVSNQKNSTPRQYALIFFSSAEINVEKLQIIMVSISLSI